MQLDVKTVRVIDNDAFPGSNLLVKQKPIYIAESPARMATIDVFSGGDMISKVVPNCFSTDKKFAERTCTIKFAKGGEWDNKILAEQGRLKRRGEEFVSCDVYVREPKVEILVQNAKDRNQFIFMPETTAMQIGIPDDTPVAVFLNPLFTRGQDLALTDLLRIEEALDALSFGSRQN
jgi:hypothetical protein